MVVVLGVVVVVEAAAVVGTHYSSCKPGQTWRWKLIRLHPPSPYLDVALVAAAAVVVVVVQK